MKIDPIKEGMTKMFCEKCGTKLENNSCSNCGFIKFHNPIPVAVALVPVIKDKITYLLGVVRNIEPKKGEIALPGGFQEIETIEEALKREVFEECNLSVEIDKTKSPIVSSTEPVPNRVLIFIPCKALDYNSINWNFTNDETQKLCLIDTSTSLAFPLHQKASRSFLENL
jgi:8-oxo-dGTP pyrophosphatase MutT (NUDIX family)